MKILIFNQFFYRVTQALIMGSIGIANSLAYAPNFQKGLISAGKMNQLFNRKPKIHDPIALDGIQPKWVI